MKETFKIKNWNEIVLEKKFTLDIIKKKFWTQKFNSRSLIKDILTFFSKIIFTKNVFGIKKKNIDENKKKRIKIGKKKITSWIVWFKKIEKRW